MTGGRIGHAPSGRERDAGGGRVAPATAPPPRPPAEGEWQGGTRAKTSRGTRAGTRAGVCQRPRDCARWGRVHLGGAAGWARALQAARDRDRGRAQETCNKANVSAKDVCSGCAWERAQGRVQPGACLGVVGVGRQALQPQVLLELRARARANASIACVRASVRTDACLRARAGARACESSARCSRRRQRRRRHLLKPQAKLRRLPVCEELDHLHETGGRANGSTKAQGKGVGPPGS